MTNKHQLGFVFPGQGSQMVGMLTDIAEVYPEIKEYYQQASDLLEIDLWQMILQGPESSLNQTANTQPAILVGSYALWQIWQKQIGIMPGFMAGHSLGEITALTCAGCITFADAVKLVRLRGELMQQAVPANIGAMAAIVGLSDEAVEEICVAAKGDEVLVPVNYNSIGQVVIGGHAAAVDRAIALAQEKKARLAKRLPMSVPSHCELIKPITTQFLEHLHSLDIKKPEIKVVNNVDVKVEMSPNKITDALVRQLYNPVRWVEIIQYLSSQGVDHMVECGPGKVLTGLIKRIDRKIERYMLGEIAEFNKTISRFQDEEVFTNVGA